MADTQRHGIFSSPDAQADTAANAKVDPQVRSLLDAGNLQGVEELFLTRLETSPLDLPLFVPVIRHFVRNKNTGLAETLLQFLLDALDGPERAPAVRSLVRAVLSIWPDCRIAKELALGFLTDAYRDMPSLPKLMDHFKVREAADPLATYAKIESWLRYDAQQGVYMEKKGVGRVKEINVAMNAIRVSFAGTHDTVSFKPDEADRLLLPLSPGHLLLDILEKPDDMRTLATADGGEILRRLFSSMARPLAMAEIKELLSPVIPAKSWSGWWTQAKQDRRLTVNAGNLCTWNDSADDADSALIKDFEKASAKERLEMAKKYGKRSPALADAMIEGLAVAAAEIAQSDPSLSLEISLARERLGGNGTPEMAGTLLRDGEPVALISGIADRILRKRALALCKEIRTEWPDLFGALLKKESDTASLAFLYESLAGAGHQALLEEIITETLASPAKAPEFFVWLMRGMMERPELERYRTWSLVQTLMQLLAKDTIKPHNAALRKLFDDGGLVDAVARRLDAEPAAQFLTLLERDSSLEEYRRDRLIKELKAFLQPASQDEDKLFYVTAKSLSARQDEFMKITTVDIPQNTEEIIKARAHGDLRENFEYHAARARQEMLSSRAKTLHDELQFARPIDFARVDPSTVCIGTTVTLAPLSSGQTVRLSILGPWDSDPEHDVFSYKARVVEGLLGKRIGDTVQFHENGYRIERITVQEVPHAA